MRKRYGIVLVVAGVVMLLVSVHAGFAADQTAQFKVPGVV
jgi:hypothetical protein